MNLIITTAILIALPLPVNAQAPPDNNQSLGDKSRNQYIVLADLRIIQAIQNLIEDNTTGASDELALAQEQLNKVRGPAGGEQQDQEEEQQDQEEEQQDQEEEQQDQGEEQQDQEEEQQEE